MTSVSLSLAQGMARDEAGAVLRDRLLPGDSRSAVTLLRRSVMLGVISSL